MMEKPLQWTAKLGKENFNPSDGWFSRFKKRVGLVHKKLYGEGQSADHTSRDAWLEFSLPSL